jgi:hypothetical protein
VEWIVDLQECAFSSSHGAHVPIGPPIAVILSTPSVLVILICDFVFRRLIPPLEALKNFFFATVLDGQEMAD